MCSRNYEPIKKIFQEQLQYAREQKFKQDKLRFAFPAAFLVYLGSLSAISNISEGNLHAILTGVLSISLIIGIGVFFATIIEHFHYSRNRDWEIELENIIIEKRYINMSDEEIKEILLQRGSFIERIRLGQPTIVYILFILSLINGLLAAGIIWNIYNNIYKFDWQFWIAIPLMSAVIFMCIFNYWSYFYNKIIDPMVKYFDKSNFKFFWLISFIILIIWIYCIFR